MHLHLAARPHSVAAAAHVDSSTFPAVVVENTQAFREIDRYSTVSLVLVELFVGPIFSLNVSTASL